MNLDSNPSLLDSVQGFFVFFFFRVLFIYQSFTVRIYVVSLFDCELMEGRELLVLTQCLAVSGTKIVLENAS